MEDYICVPIRSELYSEFILRSGKHTNVANWMSNIIEDFLDRTEDDAIWSTDYRKRKEQLGDSQFVKRYGNSKKGYYWKALFLPNSTKLKMHYQGKDFIAEVRHQQIIFNQKEYTPSSFANSVANNTSRNAWRDIWIQFPRETEWIFSNDLRT